MRYTKKRNGKNVIPLLNAVCGLNMPYWRIDRPDNLHSYLSGDAADKLAAYEDAGEQGRLASVVRCGECRYAYDSVGGWCCSHGVCVDCIVREDFFCSDGERKDGDGDV